MWRLSEEKSMFPVPTLYSYTHLEETIEARAPAVQFKGCTMSAWHVVRCTRYFKHLHCWREKSHSQLNLWILKIYRKLFSLLNLGHNNKTFPRPAQHWLPSAGLWRYGTGTIAGASSPCCGASCSANAGWNLLHDFIPDVKTAPDHGIWQQTFVYTRISIYFMYCTQYTLQSFLGYTLLIELSAFWLVENTNILLNLAV